MIYEEIRKSKAANLMAQTGLKQPISDLYWNIRFSTSEGTQEIEAVDSQAEMYTETIFEFKRCKTGMAEQEILNYFRSRIEENDVVYDIGANTGLYILISAEKAAKVVSFEPHSETRQRLKQNLELNDFENVEVLGYAASSENGREKLTG